MTTATTAESMDRMLTREEVAKIFGIKPKTTYKWVDQGKISPPDKTSSRCARFPISRIRADYFALFGRRLDQTP